jgi:protein SFI1
LQLHHAPTAALQVDSNWRAKVDTALRKRFCKLVAAVLQAWHAAADDATVRRNAAACVASVMHERLVQHALARWNKHAQACTLYASVLAHKAFGHLAEYSARKRAQGLQLQIALMKLQQSSLLRMVQAWRQHAEGMVLKRNVFARKQRALRSALAMGAQLRWMRNRRLLAAAMQTWSAATTLRSPSQALECQHRLRCMRWACSVWLALERARKRRCWATLQWQHGVQRKALVAWNTAAEQLAELAARHMLVAGAHAEAKLASRCVHAWAGVVEQLRTRKNQLQVRPHGRLSATALRMSGIAPDASTRL